jgi:N-acetylneuraminic acid mutarotase
MIFLNGVFYSIGGFDNRSYLDTCEKISTSSVTNACKSSKWESIAPMNQSRAKFGVCVINQTTIYVFGGEYRSKDRRVGILSSIEKYMPGVDKWQKLSI